MANEPFRFLHAGDFHLERPLMGVADVPDHLRDLFLESPYVAAGRVFDAALAEDVRFVLLTGGIVTSAAGPRGAIFLAEQFARLAERDINIYWAGSPIDPPEAWPAAVALPRNVHFFPRGQVESLVVLGNRGPLARLAGTSCDEQRPWRPGDFSPDTAGLYTVAVAHGQPDPIIAASRGLHYWALGGRHERVTPHAGPPVVHFCGTPQGRLPDESGIHGCTLVQVDEQCQTRTSLIPTDAARWIGERLVVDDMTTREDLEGRLRERIGTMIEAAPATALLITWTIAGRGPLLALLRRGGLAVQCIESLRSDFGYRRPLAWSVSLEAELSDTLPPEWYEQETIRGDFLRTVRRLQMNPAEPLVLEEYLAESHLAGTLAAEADGGIPNRDAVLREAALLGIDLLGGEEHA